MLVSWARLTASSLGQWNPMDIEHISWCLENNRIFECRQRSLEFFWHPWSCSCMRCTTTAVIAPLRKREYNTREQIEIREQLEDALRGRRQLQVDHALENHWNRHVADWDYVLDHRGRHESPSRSRSPRWRQRDARLRSHNPAWRSVARSFGFN